MLILYQFPISHFCEKIRWALDHKKLEYKLFNLLPGPHVSKTKKLTPKSTVPILVHDKLLHDKKVIQNSSDIITYLDETFPQRPLTPEQEDEKKEALDWEKYLDKEIGVHIRITIYSVILDHPAILIPFFCHNGPWYAKYFYKIIFPKLREKMILLMNINEQTAQQSKQRLELAIDKVYKHLQEHNFLVANTFTRADLTAAALLAPLCKPNGYGITWPRYPEKLEELIETNHDKIAWALKLYEKYR